MINIINNNFIIMFIISLKHYSYDIVIDNASTCCVYSVLYFRYCDVSTLGDGINIIRTSC